MKNLKNKVVLEDTRHEMESFTEQTKAHNDELRSKIFLTNLIFDAIR
jgi:hypothetical protein